jgi:predicted nucleic acid-binding protein
LHVTTITITIAEVLTGPLQAADDALARRYRAILESWQPIALDIDIAEGAARLRVCSASSWQTPFKRLAP